MKNIKELVLFILIFTINVFIGAIVKYIFSLFGIIYTQDNLFLYSIIDCLASFIMVLILILVYHKVLKKDIKNILKKDKIVMFIVFVFTGYCGLIFIETTCSILERILSLIFNITIASSDNQMKIESIMHVSPWIMAISASLLAPIEEELLFRCSIRQTIKNKGVFIAVSGLFFGLLHITGNLVFLMSILLLGFIISNIISSNYSKTRKTLLSVMTVGILLLVFMILMILIYGNIANYINTIKLSELINGITYVGLGVYLASIYVYTDNICYTIGIHMITNTMATILLLKN